MLDGVQIGGFPVIVADEGIVAIAVGAPGRGASVYVTPYPPTREVVTGSAAATGRLIARTVSFSDDPADKVEIGNYGLDLIWWTTTGKLLSRAERAILAAKRGWGSKA